MSRPAEALSPQPFQISAEGKDTIYRWLQAHQKAHRYLVPYSNPHELAYSTFTIYPSRMPFNRKNVDYEGPSIALAHNFSADDGFLGKISAGAQLLKDLHLYTIKSDIHTEKLNGTIRPPFLNVAEAMPDKLVNHPFTPDITLIRRGLDGDLMPDIYSIAPPTTEQVSLNMSLNLITLPSDGVGDRGGYSLYYHGYTTESAEYFRRKFDLYTRFLNYSVESLYSTAGKTLPSGNCVYKPMPFVEEQITDMEMQLRFFAWKIYKDFGMTADEFTAITGIVPNPHRNSEYGFKNMGKTE